MNERTPEITGVLDGSYFKANGTVHVILWIHHPNGI